jgi:hypothetical protein
MGNLAAKPLFRIVLKANAISQVDSNGKKSLSNSPTNDFDQ